MRFHIALVLALSAIFLPMQYALGHPTEFTHDHTSQSIQWELFPPEDGTTAHNHYTIHGFGNWQSQSGIPFSLRSCWDNQESRMDSPIPFLAVDIAHCHVEQASILEAKVPLFDFEGPGWESQAKNRIRDAFEEWSSVTSSAVNVGALFYEGNIPTAHIKIFWVETLPGIAVPPDATGSFNHIKKEMHFKKTVNWNYSKSPGGIPSDEYHFYSTALHEVGHAFGFNPTINSDSVMWVTSSSPKIGAPTGQGGLHFSGIKDGDKDAIRSVYGVTRAAPQPCDDPIEAQFISSFGYCNGNYANMQITADLFNYEVTNARYEHKLGSNPWEIFYEGLLTCPSTLQIGRFLVRAFLETEYGTSSCQMWVYPPPCEPGEPGW